MNVVSFSLAALTLAQAVCSAQSPVITNQPVSRVVWRGATVSFDVGVAGSQLSYQWQLNKTNLPNGIITTVAGGGGNYPGNGRPATEAVLYPYAVAVDCSGNLFIGDNRGLLFKVNTSGIITTVAGGGVNYPGDGGAATNASLKPVAGVAVDHSGNLCFSDSDGYNNRVRKVDANGIITTIAGGGTNYPGDGGAATNASLWEPTGVALDASGNLFIADAYNNRIRQVDAYGIITTVAGNGSAGNSDGSFSGDGGAATNAGLASPRGVALDASGNLFIADAGNNRIRRVGTNGIITTLAGDNGYGYSSDGVIATNTSLWTPTGVAVDGSDDVVIADLGNNRIRQVGTNGILTTVAGDASFAYSGDGLVATNATLWQPYGVAVDGSGDLFIADSQNNRVRKVTNTLRPVLTLNNVSAANAGSYQVVVTGSGGSVTSTVATLTVAASPFVYRTVHNQDDTVTLYFVTPPDSTNIVLVATNLVSPVTWKPVSTNVAGADGCWQYTDTSASGSRARFYRSASRE